MKKETLIKILYGLVIIIGIIILGRTFYLFYFASCAEVKANWFLAQTPARCIDNNLAPVQPVPMVQDKTQAPAVSHSLPGGVAEKSAPVTLSPVKTAGGSEESIIQEWRPRTAYVDCKAVADGKTFAEQSGSGYVYGYDASNGQLFILTNKHVMTMTAYGASFIPTSCDIRVPGDSQSATIYNNAAEMGLVSSAGEDYTLFNIPNPTPFMLAMEKNLWDGACQGTAELGEPIIILGYPEIGDQNDITVTDGIISGYDGNYYITSAKIEHGDSGGLAVSLKNNCFLGIPSYADVGDIESLARILKADVIFPN